MGEKNGEESEDWEGMEDGSAVGEAHMMEDADSGGEGKASGRAGHVLADIVITGCLSSRGVGQVIKYKLGVMALWWMKWDER